MVRSQTPGDRVPAEGAEQGQLAVGTIAAHGGAFHLPVQVGNEREQRSGEAFTERSLPH